MITVIVKMTVRPEKRREFVQTMVAMADPARKQHGCVSRGFYQNARDEDSFILLEEWETRRDLNRHVRSDWFHVLRGTRNLLRDEPRITSSVSSRSALVGPDVSGGVDTQERSSP